MYALSCFEATAPVGFLLPLAFFASFMNEVSENLLRSDLLGLERSALVQRPRFATGCC